MIERLLQAVDAGCQRRRSSEISKCEWIEFGDNRFHWVLGHDNWSVRGMSYIEELLVADSTIAKQNLPFVEYDVIVTIETTRQVVRSHPNKLLCILWQGLLMCGNWAAYNWSQWVRYWCNWLTNIPTNDQINWLNIIMLYIKWYFSWLLSFLFILVKFQQLPK